LSFPEIDRLHEYPSSPKVMYKSVMRRVLRRHRREIPDKLFGETDPFRHRRRKSHSPHICNAIMQKVYKALRSSKNYTSRIQEVKKRFGCKKEPRMPMSVIKQQQRAAMQCKCKSSSQSCFHLPASWQAAYWRFGGTHWE
jgi:hypothetical protein